jgi:hypothetical protein
LYLFPILEISDKLDNMATYNFYGNTTVNVNNNVAVNPQPQEQGIGGLMRDRVNAQYAAQDAQKQSSAPSAGFTLNFTTSTSSCYSSPSYDDDCQPNKKGCVNVAMCEAAREARGEPKHEIIIGTAGVFNPLAGLDLGGVAMNLKPSPNQPYAIVVNNQPPSGAYMGMPAGGYPMSPAFRAQFGNPVSVVQIAQPNPFAFLFNMGYPQ